MIRSPNRADQSGENGHAAKDQPRAQKGEISRTRVDQQPVVENVRFYALKVTIAFSEALYSSIRTDLRLIEALKSLTIESRHLLDHCVDLSDHVGVH